MLPKSKTLSSKTRENIYKCTACNKTIRSTYDANLHPLIATLVCRKCYTTYGTGDFKADFEDGVDENGDDNFCRWCCDGGDLFGCMRENPKCHYSFCKDCISRNCPDDQILNADDPSCPKFHWECYACDKTRLSKLTQNAQAVLKELNEKRSRRNDEVKESESVPTKKRKDVEPAVPKQHSNTPPRITPPKLTPISAGAAKLNGLTNKSTCKSVTSSTDKQAIASVNSKFTSTSRVNKRPLTASDLADLINLYRNKKDNCLEEINTKFNLITEMLLQKEPKRKLVDMEIDSLRTPFIDLQAMSNELRKLNKST